MPRESITMYAPPYALRSTTHSRGTVAAAYACTSSAPWRIMPRHSRSRPGSKPGVSTNVTIGRLKASHVATNRAALRDASMSSVPARCMRLVRDDADRRGRRAIRSPVTRFGAYRGRSSRNESASSTSSTTTRTSYDAVERSGTTVGGERRTSGRARRRDSSRGGSAR